jgi:seryl-tRNA synthetase
MIDIKLLRENLETVIENLSKRGGDFSYLNDLVTKDENRRQIIQDVERLKQERNEKSKLIGELKRNKQDATDVLASIGNIGDQIKALDEQLNLLDEDIQYRLLMTPNLLHESVPIGKDEKENVELKRYLEAPVFSFTPKAHYEIGEALKILDFERASKITGSRFVVYRGLGARLEISLIKFMMDLHARNHGYTEIIPPYIVNKASMIATGQLPKFEEDSFRLANGAGEWYLNPTAEVPTINLYRDEIIDAQDLPLKFVSYTMAFRSEAGSAGRDTRGLIRTHQFNKVELIQIADPENSYQQLDQMLEHAEEVLKQLKLPYRVVALCSGDMGFGMAKTYDIEVWIPSQNMYREIGSISNAGAFQARRSNMKIRRAKDAKLEYAHTLNGSGLAVGRTLVAILENYQKEDGSVEVPEVLIPYMGVKTIK